MTIADESQRRMDAYLERLRRSLHGMRDEDAREIVAELRSHILDKTGDPANVSALDSALAALGSPENLAAEYLTDDLLSRAEATRSPLLILRSLFRWASLSLAGFFILAGSVVAYFLGFVLAWAAFFKVVHPQTVGLWSLPQPSGDYALSLHMGFAAPPATGHEILGWWIIPFGLVAGLGLFFLTLDLDLRCIRQFRRSRASRVRSGIE